MLQTAVRGWLDDSRRGKMWSVGGYIGSEYQWEFFEEEWPKALKLADVPYFHMKETGKPNGIFAKWHPPQEHKDEWASFYANLAQIISDSHIFGILSVVRGGDLDRFNAEKNLDLEPYPLAAYGCMLLAARQHIPRMPIQLVFDRVEKVRSKLATARIYADSDAYWPGECDFITVSSLVKGVTLENLPPMQAADFAAWEFRKHQERIDEWYESGGDEVPDANEAWEKLEQWILEKYGSHEAITRKSAYALIESQRFANLVWDYRVLNEVHELRGGVWGPIVPNSR
jgi:hypothetical protein